MKLFTRKTQSKAEETPALTRTEALSCTAERAPAVSWELQENGEVRLEYPLALKPFFISLAQRFGKITPQRLTRKIELDSTGAKVWLMLDGDSTVKEIIKQIAAETGLSLQEAEIAVTTFLKTLGKRGLVYLKQPHPKT
jgi:hypothetical protein